MAKKLKPKRRVGFGRVPERRSPAAARRAEQAQAERNFPTVKKKLEKIRQQFTKNLASGRNGYRKSLLEIYSLVSKWETEDKFESRLETVGKLRGVAPRDNANRFSGIVAICLPREGDNRNAISRWSCKLDKAFEQEITPKHLMEFLTKSR